MLDTVIFDLDGTLLYTIEDLAEGVNHALESFGYTRHSVEEVRLMVGNGIRNLIKQAIPGGEGNPDFEDVFTSFKEFYTDNCMNKTRPYDGIKEMLKCLKNRGYKLAIVSNKNYQAVKRLTEFFFADEITVCIGQIEGVSKKPSPDSVFMAMKELGSSACTTVYVGDSEVDYETAKNAGIPGLIVSWGFRDRELLEKLPNIKIIDSPEELSIRLQDGE